MDSVVFVASLEKSTKEVGKMEWLTDMEHLLVQMVQAITVTGNMIDKTVLVSKFTQTEANTRGNIKTGRKTEKEP
jgi:hypothetical protein